MHAPQRLTAAPIDALPPHEVTVTFQSGSSSQTHTYKGALLLDVMTLAEPGFDPNVKNDALAHVVTATGSDGYRATVAWGELDPGFEAKPILVATFEDGQPLGDAGPRLVVPRTSEAAVRQRRRHAEARRRVTTGARRAALALVAVDGRPTRCATCRHRIDRVAAHSLQRHG